LIADEVQTGFARTGKMFAMEHHDVAADLMTMAKSLAGGFPLAAVTGRAEIMDAPGPGGLGGTYAGNPLALPPPMPCSTSSRTRSCATAPNSWAAA
jgi:4-aminobutyrate aminotransferase